MLCWLQYGNTALAFLVRSWERLGSLHSRHGQIGIVSCQPWLCKPTIVIQTAHNIFDEINLLYYRTNVKRLNISFNSVVLKMFMFTSNLDRVKYSSNLQEVPCQKPGQSIVFNSL